jgi:hypothetical protein
MVSGIDSTYLFGDNPNIISFPFQMPCRQCWDFIGPCNVPPQHPVGNTVGLSGDTLPSTWWLSAWSTRVQDQWWLAETQVIRAVGQFQSAVNTVSRSCRS